MWLLTPLLGLALATAAAAGSYEEPPINYNSATPADDAPFNASCAANTSVGRSRFPSDSKL